MRLHFVLIVFALAAASMLSAQDATPVKEGDAPVKRAAAVSEHGLELYSWHTKFDDAWHFALLPAPGIEKLRTAGLVATKENAIDGVDALKKRFAALAVNEKVGW